MATEQGIVIKTGPLTAWVRTKRSSACETCSSRKSCHSLSGKVDDMEVEAINETDAKEGDTILLSLETSSFLKATFLLYVFPILFLLIGAIIGQYFAPDVGIEPSVFSAIVGFSLFFLSIVIVRTLGNHLSTQRDYRPKIVKIISRA